MELASLPYALILCTCNYLSFFHTLRTSYISIFFTSVWTPGGRVCVWFASVLRIRIRSALCTEELLSEYGKGVHIHCGYWEVMHLGRRSLGVLLRPPLIWRAEATLWFYKNYSKPYWSVLIYTEDTKNLLSIKYFL